MEQYFDRTARHSSLAKVSESKPPAKKKNLCQRLGTGPRIASVSRV
jgi:hypothetical protein